MNDSEPSRPTPEEVEAELTAHVQALAGPDAKPRPEQLAAVTAMLAEQRRTLLVARTGFGKSAVYFSATRMLRDRGWGPTIVVSPLLALMRDQVAAAKKLRVNAVSINSSNFDSWASMEEQIHNDEIDLLLISPERLANHGFRRRIFDTLMQKPFALVCDEAHCISDWGHDFRPDYRRLRRILADLPAWTPVLATTATANQRVTDDVAAQLGEDTLVLRTTLDRESLHLSVVDLPDDSHRLAWLAETIDRIPGSGIIYCLTVNQAKVTADWLNSQGHKVAAYSGAAPTQERLAMEDQLRDNQIKALVATSALGMGYDKGDLAFCIHLGLPPSPVAYYQQIGRAGRALERAEVIAVPRPVEDAQVWRWFESVSLPSEEVCQSVLDALDFDEPTGVASLETTVNLGRSRLGTLLNILDVDGAVARYGRGWVKTPSDWTYDHQLASKLRELRQIESSQMLDWASLDTCRLRYLRETLDDHSAQDCGRCDRCTELSWHSDPDPVLVGQARNLLRGADIEIAPRKQWPSGLGEPKGRIKPAFQAQTGRALARTGDGGWSPIVVGLMEKSASGDSVELPSELITSLAAILKRWDWDERPTWICPMPSRRHSSLNVAVAVALGEIGKLPVYHALTSADDGEFQANQSNSAHQLGGPWGRLEIDAEAMPEDSIRNGPVLLVDDEIISRWTFAVAAFYLATAGSGPVLPLALQTR